MNEATQASLYGRGVFTTITIYDRQPFLWGKHWRRLANDAERVGIDLTHFSSDNVRAALLDTVARESIGNGRARITFTDERPGEIWPGRTPAEATSMSIIPGEIRPVPRPFKCFVSPHTVNSRSPLAGVKSCSYLENILAVEGARSRGLHEAIRLNERGHIAGACMANVFWLKNGQLFTPSLSTGCLPGTTREFVIENIECGEVEAGLDALKEVDSMFLTSAGLGVAAVDDFNGRPLSAADHPILSLIREQT